MAKTTEKNEGLKTAETENLTEKAEGGEVKPPAITPHSDATTSDATTNPPEISKPVGTVLPTIHPEKVFVTDEVKAAREDAKTRLSVEIENSKRMAERQEALRTPSEEDTVTIKLKKKHTHNGVAYDAGDEIKVDEQAAAFIVEQHIGERG